MFSTAERRKLSGYRHPRLLINMENQRARSSGRANYKELGDDQNDLRIADHPSIICFGFWFFLTQSKQRAQAVANEKAFCEGLTFRSGKKK